MDKISARTVPTDSRALRTRTALPRPVVDRLASLLQNIANAGFPTGMPVVPVGENSVQQTQADAIVGGLYVKIVKRDDLSTLNVDLERLCRALAESASMGELETEQRVTNIYLGKALNLLCRVGGQEPLPCASAVLVRAVNWCMEVLRGRTEFTLENLCVIMFHLGGLMNRASVAEACSEMISGCLAPHLDQMLKAAPQQAVACPILSLALASALRASEVEMRLPVGATVPRFAPDALLTTLRAVKAECPGLLAGWESRSLALVAKYGAQYLNRLGEMSRRCRSTETIVSQHLNVAHLLKAVIEEARLPHRAVWQYDGAYRSLAQGKELRDQLAYAARYYCRWLAGQPERIRASFELAEPPRGPFPDNLRDERAFAEVARLGVDVATTQAGVINAPAPPDADIADEVCMAAEPPPPAPDLARFDAIAGALVRYGENADRFDREDVIAAVNTLVASIESGRTVLTQAQRVQMLLNMDAVCRQLATASPQPSHYAWQLDSMRGFLSTQLAQVVGTNGKPLMAADLPDSPGLSAWQRSLLVILNSCEGAR